MNCCLCQRSIELTNHHLIPKVLHRKLRKKKYKKDVLSRTIDMCRYCHDHIHILYTEKELFRNYNTLELLLTSVAIQKFIKFIRKRK